MSQQAFLPVGNGKEELPEFYIPRSISPVFVKTEDILNLYKSSQDTQIIFNCDDNFERRISKNRTINTMETLQYLSGTAEKTLNAILLSTTSKCTILQFETICSKSGKLNVYLFQHFDTDDCILTLKKGKQLVPETSCKNKTIKDIEVFEHFTNPLQVCCSPPGRGKSTLMKFFYNICPSDSFAVFVNLIDYDGFLAEQPDFSTIFCRFLRIDGKDNDLFNKPPHFWERVKLYMFLDGLDEISSQRVERILSFVKHLTSKGVNVWVSSRENLQENICEALNAVPMEIKELEEEEEERYIRSKLKQSYAEEEIQRIHRATCNNAYVRGSQNLLGVPLRLHVLTEMFLQDRGVYESLENKDLFVLTRMYRIFFEGKVKFACNELGAKQFVDPKYILQLYEVPALKACLDKRDYENLNLEVNQDADSAVRDFWRILKNEGDKCGIIKMINHNDEAVFGHQTYAEYFASVWLRKNPSKMASLKDRIFTKKYETLRLMLDVLLAEKNPLHLAIIYKDVGQVEAHIEELSSKDEGGRTGLHLASSCGRTFNGWESDQRETRWYVKIVEKLFGQSESKDISETKDHVFELDCVEYALRSNCLYPIEVMLQTKWVTFSRIKRPLKYKYDRRCLISFVAKCGYPNLFFKLIKDDKQRYYKDLRNGSLLQIAVEGCPGDDCTSPREGNIEIVKTLIRNYKVKVDGICECLRRAKKCFDMLELLLKHHAKCSLHTPDLVTCCHETSYFSKVLDAMKKYKIDMNGTNENGETAFHKVAASADVKVLKELMENGASPQVLDSSGASVLHYASRNSRQGVLEVILANGLGVNAKDESGVTPLHLASSNAITTNVRILLTQGADPNVVDNDGNNALHHALKSSDATQGTIRLLVETGVDVNAQNEDGVAPLHLASENRRVGVVELLLKQGARPNLEDNVRNNALHYAVKSSTDTEDKIRLLVREGVDVNAKNADGLAPIHVCYKNSDFATSHFLFANVTNLEVNAKLKNGRTLLHLACRNPFTEPSYLLRLLDAGADANILDDDHKNALHYSLPRACNTVLVHAMIKHGVDPNARYENGQTLLHVACSECDVRTVRELVERGADVNALDDKKRSPLHVAFMCLEWVPSKWYGRKSVKLEHAHESGEWRFECERCCQELVTFITSGGDGAEQILSKFISNNEVLDIFRKHIELDYDPSEVIRRLKSFVIINYLIENGAQIGDVDCRGKTQLDYAFKWRKVCPEVVDLLRLHFPQIVRPDHMLGERSRYRNASGEVRSLPEL